MLVQRPQLWDSRLSASLLGSTGVPPMAAFCSLAGCRRKPGSSVFSSQPAGMVTAKETGPAWRTAGPLAQEEPCVQARESQEVVPTPQPRGTRKAPIYRVILCKSLPHPGLTPYLDTGVNRTLHIFWSVLFTCKCLINLCLFTSRVDTGPYIAWG